VAILGLLLVLLPGLAWGKAGPVLVAPVLDPDTGAPDQELLWELALAARLQGLEPPAWHFGEAPAGACNQGCSSLEIRGRRTPAANYRLVITGAEGARRRTLTLVLEESPTTFSLAQLLLLKSLDLLAGKGEELPPPKAAPLPVAPPALARPSAPPIPADISLGAGLGGLVGLDSWAAGLGPELNLRVQTAHSLVLKAGAGWLFLGREMGGRYDLKFQALQLQVLGGLSLQRGAWTLDLLAGGAALEVFAQLPYFRDRPRSDAALGLAAEFHAQVQPLREAPRLSLGFWARPFWMANPITFWHGYLETHTGQDGMGGTFDYTLYWTRRHTFPALMLGLGADCSWRF
jgi:hypothetical protein